MNKGIYCQPDSLSSISKTYLVEVKKQLNCPLTSTCPSFDLHMSHRHTQNNLIKSSFQHSNSVVRDTVQLREWLSSMHVVVVWIPATRKLGMVAHVCNPSKRSRSSQSTLTTWIIRGQPGSLEILSKKNHIVLKDRFISMSFLLVCFGFGFFRDRVSL